LAAELLHQDLGQLGRRDQVPLDEDLPEPLTARGLLCERFFELLLADHPAGDEECADRAPRNACSLHDASIGTSARNLEPTTMSSRARQGPTRYDTDERSRR